MTRQNFTQNTKDHLARAANFRCVRPGCQKITHSQSCDGKKIVGTAVASHDIPASPNGPGNNMDLTPEQIKAVENGAWLCAICARLVDHDRIRFPTGTISKWQEDAAAYITQHASTPYIPSGINLSDACRGAQLFCQKASSIQINGNIHGPIGISWESICAVDALIEECYLLGPLNPLSTLFPHTLNLQYRALNCLKILTKMFRNNDHWFYENNSSTYCVVSLPFGIPIDNLRSDVSYAWCIWTEFSELIFTLRQFSNGLYKGPEFLSW